MSIDNSMFAEYLSSISENIKRSGSDVEFGFDRVTDKLDDINISLTRISEELLISNLPIELRNDQRNMFELIDSNKSLLRLIKSHNDRISRNPESIESDSLRIESEHWSEMYKINLNSIIELEKKGCIR